MQIFISNKFRYSLSSDSSSDSVKHAPLENQLILNENSSFSSPNHQLFQLIEKAPPLDKSTRVLRLEDSSDKLDSSFVKDHELPPRDNSGSER